MTSRWLAPLAGLALLAGACSEDAGGGSDAAAPDAAVAVDTGATDGASDPGAADPGAPDEGAPDPGVSDPGAADEAPADAPTGDLGPTLDAVSDPGAADAGGLDAGPTDAAGSDGGPADAAIADAGTDAGGPAAPVGQLNVVWWATDALFDFPEVYAHAVFSAPLAATEPLDAVGWLAAAQLWPVFLGDDWWTLPDEGATALYGLDEPADDLGALAAGDAGTAIVLGDALVAHVEEITLADGGPPIYDSLLEEGADMADLFAPGDALALAIEGGADVAAATLADAVPLPHALVITSHDVTQPLPLRYGTDLVLTWEPPPAGAPASTLAITVEGWDGTAVGRVADADGAVNLTTLFAGEWADLGTVTTVGLARVVETEVTLAEGPLRVVSSYKQWLYPEPVGAWDLTPRRWPTGETVDVTLRVHDHALDPATVALTLDPPLPVAGLEVVDAQGHVLRFRVTVAADAITGPVAVTVASGGGEVLSVPQAAWVAAPLPSAGDCASAVDEGPLPDGAYWSTDLGLDGDGFTGTDSCPGLAPTGREQAIPLSLLAGETLTVRYERDQYPGVMYLATGCSDGAPVFPCAATPTRHHPATLTYTAWDDEDLLLILDSIAPIDAAPDPFVVDIRRTGPAPFVVEPNQAVDGVTEAVTLLSLVGDLDLATTVSADFGPGTTVDTLTVVDADLAEASVTVDSATDPLLRDVTVTVDGVDHTVPDGFRVIPFLVPPSTCDEAIAGAALGPGLYQGLTLSQYAVGGGACVDDAEGSEALLPVALGPGETLRALVTMHDGGDAVLYVAPTCATGALACVDDSGSGHTEFVQFTAPPDGATVVLVVDAFELDFGLLFDLILEVGP